MQVRQHCVSGELREQAFAGRAQDREPDLGFFFASCALVSLSLSVTGERDEKQSEAKEDAVQPN